MMKHFCSIRAPELLHISNNGTISYGANQTWYYQEWQRLAGCGPTACSHLMWYLSQTRDNCAALCEYDGRNRRDFVSLMEDVWKYVTPGNMGVNTSKIFIDGAILYGKDRGVSLKADSFEISPRYRSRGKYEELEEFLIAAFERDLPVAFLNLSNGSLSNLDNWHWVTLISLDERGALMYDQGRRSNIDLKRWLKSSALGGAFVTLESVNI